jgi:type II restriction enzyme
MYNNWFTQFAPATYQAERLTAIAKVANDLIAANDFIGLTGLTIQGNSTMLPTLRMACCPPLARDRMAGLAYVDRAILEVFEAGNVPNGMLPAAAVVELNKFAAVFNTFVDKFICPWLNGANPPTQAERDFAASIIADRLTGAVADPLIRNEQEKRQLAVIEGYLVGKGYTKLNASPASFAAMPAGSFCFRMVVKAGATVTRIPVDVVIKPLNAAAGTLPILIEAKSAGDFANVNKRRKEESDKNVKLQHTHPGINFVLFLCGYFPGSYLGHMAGEQIDWVWEHRVNDLAALGI